jgi:hypothetical protein
MESRNSLPDKIRRSSGGGIKIDEGTLKKIAAISLFAWQGTGIFFVL